MQRHVVIGGELRHVQGWKRSRLKDTKAMMAEPPVSVDIPPSADISKLGLPILDQGDLGCCTAAMGTKMMSILSVKNGGPPLDLSLFDLYAEERLFEGTPLTEDSGAEITTTRTVLEKQGVCTEATWPSTPRDRFLLTPSTEAAVEAAKHEVLLSYGCPSVRTMRAALAQGFPVGIGIVVFAGLMSDECARTGICPMPAPGEASQGGHAVTLVGYDDTMVIGPNTGAFLVQNSWSDSWGSAGCFWLPYVYVEQFSDDAFTDRRAS